MLTSNNIAADTAGAYRAAGSVHSRVRSQKRQVSRERIHERVVHPIDTPRLMRDPLERRESRAVSAITAIRLGVGAAIIHGLVMVGFALMSQIVGERQGFHPPERLKVSIVEPPPAPPPVPEPPKVAGPVIPEFTPPAPPKRELRPLRKEQPTEVPPAAEVAPEPIQRRVVGLSLESTVEGKGPSFATGTTRMGSTENTAADPKLAAKSPTVSPSSVEVGTPGDGLVQRVATRIPTRDVEFEKPKRISTTEPEYPATLKAQNIEGDVQVNIDIAPSGEVVRVVIVRGSGHSAFDEAARQAALRQRYSPAKRDGRPLAYTLSYTFRFRIED